MSSCLHVCMCMPPPQDIFLQVPPSGGTLCVIHRHTYPLNPPPCHGGALRPPPRAMGCNRNRPDINTTTVGGRGGTGGLCIPVVIAPSRRTRRGGGFGKWTSVTPRGRKPIFPHPMQIRQGAATQTTTGLAAQPPVFIVPPVQTPAHPTRNKRKPSIPPQVCGAMRVPPPGWQGRCCSNTQAGRHSQPSTCSTSPQGGRAADCFMWLEGAVRVAEASLGGEMHGYLTLRSHTQAVATCTVNGCAPSGTAIGSGPLRTPPGNARPHRVQTRQHPSWRADRGGACPCHALASRTAHPHRG